MNEYPILFVDHHDSFSKTLLAKCQTFGLSPIFVCEEDIPYFLNQGTEIGGVVLSPGPGRPEHYGNSLRLLELIPSEMPLLGVCLGFQLLYYFFGVEVEKVTRNPPLHGIRLDVAPFHLRWTGEKKIFGKACFFNSLGVPLDAGMKISRLKVVSSLNSLVVVAEHFENPWVGVQFHPESFATNFGTQILRGFASAVKSFLGPKNGVTIN